VNQRPSPPRRPGARVGLRVFAATVSALVLFAVGLGYHFYSELTGGIATSDVILGGEPGKPAGSDVNILLVGVDSRTDAQGRPLSKQVLAQLRAGPDDGVLNSDTIIMLHVPADGSRATAISIPRDTYVEIPGYGKNKINSAYPTATVEAANKLREEGDDPQTVVTESRTAGRTELIKTVERFTGVKIDHYAEVNLLGFYHLTQAIGGVDVCLKHPVHEWRSGADFPAGRQTISGADALAFVRQRHELPQGDFSRIRRQQVFLAAVAHKILSAGTLASPSKLHGLIDAAKESVVLDSGWNVLSFARQASNLAGGNFEFLTIPIQGGTTNSHGDVVLANPGEVRRFVAAHFGMPTPDGAEAFSDTGQAMNTIPADRITVDVRNGSGRVGLAGDVASALADQGYRRGEVDNVSQQKITVVHYPPGDAKAAEQVADVLGVANTQQDATVPAGSVRVYLASDFSLSDIHSTADDSTSATGSTGSGDSTSATGSTGSGDSEDDAELRSVPAGQPPAPPITADGVPCVD
jgi:LCP family protein required for cell wall assembly